MTVTRTFDPVTLTVIENYLASTCRDMGVTMMTTAYSPIFNESLDFSCVMFNTDGEMLAQAEFCPSQIGTIKFTVAWTIAELGLDGFEEGDIVIHNDPYRGSGHAPEHMLLMPVFYQGEPIAFVANVAHMSENGAKTPGGLSGDATEIYQEGLLVPPVKLRRRGEDVPDIWHMILSNHRTPRVTYGDLRAMIGSLELGRRRVLDLVGSMGLATFVDYSQELIAVAERRMRAEILLIPDGSYRFTDTIEDDGLSERSYDMQLLLTVDRDEIIADFTGSAPQAIGPVNAIYAVTASAVYNAFLHLTDPSIPRNEGAYRPFTIIAPYGSIVNSAFPAPVAGGNTETSPRITDMIFGALAEAIPERVAASCGGTSSPFLFGGRDVSTGEAYAHFHFEGVGWGGRAGADGNNMVVTINGNCRNTPVEVFETRYPAFRIESYRLMPDSGGPGKYRGGLGGERVFQVIADEVTVSALLNRMLTSPWGVLGGGEGAVGGLWVRPKNQTTWLTFVEAFGTHSPSKFSGVTLHEGDAVKIRMPGGGGYGDPADRAPAAVAHDVREGFVSEEAARDFYGWRDDPGKVVAGYGQLP
jgi:N-methylhydantoinase B/oxoprolinase/acetone carboxylase alpha subunit